MIDEKEIAIVGFSEEGKIITYGGIVTVENINDYFNAIEKNFF